VFLLWTAKSTAFMLFCKQKTMWEILEQLPSGLHRCFLCPEKTRINTNEGVYQEELSIGWMHTTCAFKIYAKWWRRTPSELPIRETASNTCRALFLAPISPIASHIYTGVRVWCIAATTRQSWKIEAKHKDKEPKNRTQQIDCVFILCLLIWARAHTGCPWKCHEVIEVTIEPGH